MRYIHGYSKKSKEYYVTIFEGGATVTLTYETYQEMHDLIVRLDSATNLEKKS